MLYTLDHTLASPTILIATTTKKKTKVTYFAGFLHKFLCTTTMASQVMGGTRAVHQREPLRSVELLSGMQKFGSALDLHRILVRHQLLESDAPMKILMDEWDIRPPSWVGSDPCVGGWEGIECTNSRITSIALADMGLTGRLPSDIELLSELEILSLKNNSFNGLIPPSIGNLTNLFFLDLSDNKLVGSFPVSNRTAPGLDQLEKARHFHFQNNQLSGIIPPKLFSSQMKLIHVIFDRNNLTGSIPSTLGLVQSLQAVRLDRNSLNGSVPSNLKNLSKIAELDMSNNTFDVSDVPSWFSTLLNLTTLMMENTRLQGEVPQALFSNYNLETLILRNNKINGLLDLETISGNHLQLIDMEKNFITDLKPSAGGSNYTLIVRISEDQISKRYTKFLSVMSSIICCRLVDNPICEGTNMANNYCIVSPSNSSNLIPPSNCASVACSLGQVSSPNCKCAYPYTGTLVFIFVSFSNLGNFSYYTTLQDSLVRSFRSYNLPVESVALGYPTFGSSYHLELFIQVFPSGQDRFNQTGASAIASVISNQTLSRPGFFGPYSAVFPYGNSGGGGSKKGLIIGAAVGGSVLLLLLALVGVYALQQKRTADEQWSRSIPLSGISNSSASAPRLKGAISFSFEELQKYTNGFSEANDVGAGGYGKVYRGILPTGQMVAIKRAKRDSMQGGPEFTAEVELLSRVHHKNLVSLLGFCLEQGEQILVYEYVPNGDLLDSLSGKSGIRLDWLRRLKIILGAARGLAYLHEHANPPIIHRDIKSNNILLDKDLTAKVADFGLSKSMADSGTDHVTTQVKGTMGYLDPEYYMTQQLTEKSDVYSFGVVMLELITARRPIEQGSI
ncbi:hypothetical protein Prudu_012547 [Prunus dulcis]|uniref:non-specific serine/threonine protein kinase n=1 Tax=Prunus dulcis TaxID=3755 RepID=A0A4Y1RDN1_PRUDU|nr:hypothetical protein Prudu_012547 [Prunus dulcis]